MPWVGAQQEVSTTCPCCPPSCCYNRHAVKVMGNVDNFLAHLKVGTGKAQLLLHKEKSSSRAARWQGGKI